MREVHINGHQHPRLRVVREENRRRDPGDAVWRELSAEPDPTLGEVLSALLELLWRMITLGPRLVAMMSLALAETLRP